MKPSILHIVLSCLLLLGYGAERLLPCSGVWDVDCPAETHAGTTDVPTQSDPEHAHDSEDSHGSESPCDHNGHQCNCPCHTVALTSMLTVAPLMAGYTQPHGSLFLSLFHTSLSPPDHVPIG